MHKKNKYVYIKMELNTMPKRYKLIKKGGQCILILPMMRMLILQRPPAI